MLFWVILLIKLAMLYSAKGLRPQEI